MPAAGYETEGRLRANRSLINNLFCDAVNFLKLLLRQRGTLQSPQVIQDLLLAGSAYQNAGNSFVLHHPFDSHAGQRLAAFFGHIVQLFDSGKFGVCQGIFMEKASVGADTAVCRDTVQIAVCQKPLFQRLESNDTLSVFGGGLLQSVFSMVRFRIL